MREMLNPTDYVPAAEAWQRCEISLLPAHNDDDKCNTLYEYIYNLVTRWTDPKSQGSDHPHKTEDRQRVWSEWEAQLLEDLADRPNLRTAWKLFMHNQNHPPTEELWRYLWARLGLTRAQFEQSNYVSDPNLRMMFGGRLISPDQAGPVLSAVPESLRPTPGKLSPAPGATGVVQRR